MYVVNKTLPTEHQIQSAFFDEIKLRFPKLHYADIFAIPNGGLRNKIVAIKMKKEGVKKGVCDVCVSIPTKLHHGAYIEFKRKNGTIKEEQKSFIERKESQGYKCCVCRSVHEAISFLTAYLREEI